MSWPRALVLAVLLAVPPACSRDDTPQKSRIETPPTVDPSALQMDLPRRLLEHPPAQGSAVSRSPAEVWEARLGPPLVALLEQYPGPCIKPTPPPMEYARWGAEQEDLSPTLLVGPDVNGDGIDDLFVSAPGYCANPIDCYHAVYVVERDCGHFAGVVIGHSFKVGDRRSKASGIHDLEVETYKGERQGDLVAFGPKRIRVLYQFDGRVYVPKKRRKCTVVDGLVLRDERCEPWTAWRGGT